MKLEMPSKDDLDIVSAQLGRPVRSVAGIAWRCQCGMPGVLATYPRLDTGQPFPTTFYLTHPGYVLACSRLEASGLMAELSDKLTYDHDLAAVYRQAHESYLKDREILATKLGEPVTEIAGISAGGMPNRVKCLHALVGHALAAGAGVNPIGDLVIKMVGDVCQHPCQIAGRQES